MDDYESDESVKCDERSYFSPCSMTGNHPVVPPFFASNGKNDYFMNYDEYESDNSSSTSTNRMDCPMGNETQLPKATFEVGEDHDNSFDSDEYESDESSNFNEDLSQDCKLPHSCILTSNEPSRPRRNWVERFEELVRFKATHGHCNVPQKSEDGLGRWVNDQRVLYKKWLENGETCLEIAQRLRQLGELGFQWNTFEMCWEQRFLALARFKESHGHCNVPQNSEDGLGRWVNQQRYYLFNARKSSDGACQGKADKVRRLNELGFQWDAGESVWEERFSELVRFKETHGHCDVPRKYGSLGIWVKSQREWYTNC